jgi:hypothetical protein
MKFVADLYQPIYDSVIQLYHDVQKDHYHAKKCRAARKKWARTAGYCEAFFIICIIF